MRRTKIICTIGPASADPGVIRELIQRGMNVARLNFSHGTYAFHEEAFRHIRAAAEELDKNVAVMMDLQGPKIRTGKLNGGEAVELKNGAAIRITTEDVPGDARCISTTYENLPHDVREGNLILIADGALELGVESVAPPNVDCRVLRGGWLGENKGINLPGVHVSAPSLTEKDVRDLEFGLKLGVDLVALSFVRSAGDLQVLRQHMERFGRQAMIVAKVERPEAYERFDDILNHTDAVMVARGDLGVEIDLEEVPQIQKDLIRRCNDRGIPVVTATQMLESMITNSRPTRAEVADIANAIYDGADAVMLSGETATGAYPLAAVEVMDKVALRADEAMRLAPRRTRETPDDGARLRQGFYSNAIGQAVAWMTQTVDAKRIVCFTKSGYTAHAMARYRPATKITAITLNEDVRRRCALVWGVDAVKSAQVRTTDEMVQMVDSILRNGNLAQEDDLVIIVAATPLGKRGRTNLLKLHRVGETM